MAIRLKALALALLLCATAQAQQYNRFGPANGILVGQTTTPQTTAAAWANIQALLTGTCDSSHLVNGAGGCVTPPAGTVSSVGLTMPSGFTVTGSPVTSSGTLAVTTTLNGLLKGNGSGFTTGAVSDVLGLFSGTCSSSVFLRGDGACAAVPAPTVTLTGDVTGSGSGSFATTLANTAVTAGSYTNTNLTVDAKGRITAASNGGAGGAVVQVAYDGSFTSRTSTTTLACSTGLTITGLNSSNIYAVHVEGTFAGSTSGGGLAFAVSGMIEGGYVEATQNANSITNVQPIANHFLNGINTFVTGFPATNADVGFIVDGLVTGATSTCFEWAQQTSSANATQLLYSYMTVIQVH